MYRMLVVLVLLSLCANTALALDGSGTQEDPYRIQSLADFDEFASDPNYWSGFTRLETDVNLVGRTYSTAVIAPDVDNSNYDFDGTPFTGVFDGNAHKIINLTIDDDGAGNDYLGLFGFIEEDAQISNLVIEGCYVIGDEYIGGLVGANGNWGNPVGAISKCYSTGFVFGDNYVGGLVGGNGGSISECYSTGDVTGTVMDVGGLVGFNYYDATISNCYSTGSVSGEYSVGGLVGRNAGVISDCYSTGDINGVGDVGGLVGNNGFSHMAGAVPGYIYNSYSTGNVRGHYGYGAGGLVAHNDFLGTISTCYSTGDVSGFSDVGGLVGYNYGTISNCHSIGFVSGDSDVGGLVGRNTEYGTISGSFWDVQTSGIGYSSGGTGKTTAEMKTRSTFTDVGWDFIEIWGIGEHQTYPYLLTGPAGDFNYDKTVDLEDLAILAEHWLEDNNPQQ